MIITTKLKMDLQRPGITPVIHAVQNDTHTRKLEIALFSGGSRFLLPDSVGVLIRYKKADGKGGEYDTLADGTPAWHASGNLLTVELVPQVLSFPGRVAMTVTLLQADAQLSIFGMEVDVEPVAKAAQAKSEEYFYVTGFLPAPGSGSVGQVLRIAAVNENGRVIAVDAADTAGAVDEAAVWQIVKEYLTKNPPADGKDGVSVTHKWVGTQLILTSASGSTTVDLKGDPGPAPVRGVDYWTANDRYEIKQYLEEVILGGEW